MAVAAVERFQQEVMYGLSAGTKKSGRRREVAVSGGSTVKVGIFLELDTLDSYPVHFGIIEGLVTFLCQASKIAYSS